MRDNDDVFQGYSEKIADNIYEELIQQVDANIFDPGDDYLENARKLISDILVSAHMMGYVHSFDEQDAQGAENFAYIIDHETIIQVLERAGLGEEYITELREKTAAKVDTIARLDFYNRMERLQKIVAENLETGLGLRDFLERVSNDELMTELGLTKRNPYYLETVYRTNYTSAYSAGKYDAAMKSPSVEYLKYASVEDDRTTDVCSELNGTVKHKNDPFWDTYMPPNHFSCRSLVIEVTRAYAKSKGITETKDVKITADHPESFRDNPAKRNGWMKPTIDMKNRLKEYEKENTI